MHHHKIKPMTENKITILEFDTEETILVLFAYLAFLRLGLHMTAAITNKLSKVPTKIEKINFFPFTLLK